MSQKPVDLNYYFGSVFRNMIRIEIEMKLTILIGGMTGALFLSEELIAGFM